MEVPVHFPGAQTKATICYNTGVKKPPYSCFFPINFNPWTTRIYNTYALYIFTIHSTYSLHILFFLCTVLYLKYTHNIHNNHVKNE